MRIRVTCSEERAADCDMSFDFVFHQRFGINASSTSCSTNTVCRKDVDGNGSTSNAQHQSHTTPDTLMITLHLVKTCSSSGTQPSQLSPQAGPPQ